MITNNEREERLLQLLFRLTAALVLMQSCIERKEMPSLFELHLKSVLRHLKTECPSLLTWTEMVYANENPPYALCQIGQLEALDGLKARL